MLQCIEPYTFESWGEVAQGVVRDTRVQDGRCASSKCTRGVRGGAAGVRGWLVRSRSEGFTQLPAQVFCLHN